MNYVKRNNQKMEVVCRSMDNKNSKVSTKQFIKYFFQKNQESLIKVKEETIL